MPTTVAGSTDHHEASRMRLTVPRDTSVQRLAVPAYFRPGRDWQRLTGGRCVVGIAVMNVASGPGHERIPDYVPALDAANDAGIEVVGYVDTDNGTRPHSHVLRDIDRYRTWYSRSGFLFDRADVTSADAIAYYGPLHQHVKALDPQGIVILNPGVTIEEQFMSVADIVIEYEGAADPYVSDVPLRLRWRKRYDRNRFWHIVYNASRDDLDTIVR